MSVLLQNLSTIFLKLLNLLNEMGKNLITNPIFIIFISTLLLTLFINLIINIIKIKEDRKELDNMPYYKLDDDEDLITNYENYDFVNDENLTNLDYDEYDDYLYSLNGNNDNYYDL